MKIILVLLILLVALLIYAATRPDSFRLQRSVLINASPEKIFGHLNDFKAWSNWSPWAKLDPAMKTTLSGSPTGVASVYEWQGNSKVGSGRMEIIESASPTLLKVKLDFKTPMEAHNITEFMLQQQGNQTQVTWAMYGPSNYVSKLMTVFVSMDKMVGGDFERGLAALKTVSET